MATRPSEDRDLPDPTSPDVLEQRQLVDGSFEDGSLTDEVADRPLSPDQVEQRQRADGSLARRDEGLGDADALAHPDVLEQHQLVTDDDLDDERPTD